MKKMKAFMLLMIVLLIAGCAQDTWKSIFTEKLEGMGYTVVEHEVDTTSRVIRSKDEEYRDIHLALFWEVQEFDLSKYEGKTINYHIYRVKNHPVDLTTELAESTELYLGVIDGEYVGGYSIPYKKGETFLGGFSSIEGKSLEELTGLTYPEWFQKWSETYE